MKKLFLILLIHSLFYSVYAQSESISSYTKKTYMIPMRDGIKLFTVVLTPAQQTNPSPFLVQRTPYGADFPVPEDSTIPVKELGTFQPMDKEGYIFVFQDMRGKFFCPCRSSFCESRCRVLSPATEGQVTEAL